MFLAETEVAVHAPVSGGKMTTGHWNDLKMARKGLLVALIPVASLLLGFASLYALSVAERRAQGWVQHTLQVRNHIARAITGVTSTESAARGFAVTGDDSFLSAFVAAREDITKALAGLAALTMGDNGQQERLTAVRDMVSARYRINEDMMDSPPGTADPALAALILHGKEETDAIRNALIEMENLEMQSSAKRTARVEQIRDVNVVATAATVAFGICGGFVSVFLLSRSTVRRIQLIGENAERLAEELPLHETAVGKDELGRLNEQLRATSALLKSRTNALRNSEARLQAILDNTSSIVFMKDLQGRFLIVNRSFEKVFGFRREVVIGHDAYCFFPAEFADAYRANDQAALNSVEPLQFEEITPQDGGERVYLSTKFALRDNHDVPYAICGVSTDITERKKAEEILRTSHGELEKHVQERTAELQEANDRLRREVAQHQETAESLRRTHAQLLQAQKMEALGQIAGGIAHDFNNILTTIIGHSNLLLDQVPPGHPDNSSVAEILRASERASALSKQLLSFSRPQPTEPVTLNLNTVIDGAEKMLVQAIGDRIMFKKTLQRDLGNTRADIGQVEQLLLNLVINARDAIRGNGEIEVTTANVSLKAEDVKSDVSTTDFVTLSVRDTGSGIPPELMTRVFEPFFTTKRPGQGTGLGLATCSAIVQESNGWMACQSQPGKGTTFTIFLPRLAQAVKGVVRPHSDNQLPRGAETLLVVEDEPAVGNLFECTLRKLGYEVVRAEHGEEAERAIAERGTDGIDLILTDLDMPRMDGVELVRRLSSRHRDLKIILTSGNGENFDGRRTAELDFEFLPKPFSIQTLAQKVREVLDR